MQMKRRLRNGKIKLQNLRDTLISSVVSTLQRCKQETEALDICLFLQKEHKDWTYLFHWNVWDTH